MRVIIAGGRNWTDRSVIENLWRQLEETEKKDITEVVSGKAPGADYLGENVARSRKILVMGFPAEWARLGKAAGPIRNQKMVDYADALILAWNGKSPGSHDVYRRAKAKGIPIYTNSEPQ